MKFSLFKHFFAKHNKKVSQDIIDSIKKGLLITLTFGDSSWRIESKPINGKSNLKLFANDELIFEGSYGELVSKIK